MQFAKEKSLTDTPIRTSICRVRTNVKMSMGRRPGMTKNLWSILEGGNETEIRKVIHSKTRAKRFSLIDDKDLLISKWCSAQTVKTSILEDLISSQQKEAIRDIFTALPLREQTALATCIKLPDALSVSQLAKKWNCSRQTIYNTSNKAKQILRKLSMRSNLVLDSNKE